MARVDDGALGAFSADQKARHFLDGLLRGRQADARETRPRQCFQPFQRQGQVSAALVGGERMDLVDDDRARGREHLAAGDAGEQDVQRFRRGDDDVRRTAAHAGALRLRRVAGAHQGADVRVRQALGLECGAYAYKRGGQVFLDVVGQCLERRDVDHVGLVGQPALNAFAHQPVDGDEERSQGLARAGGRGDQGMLSRLDGGPGFDLRGRGRGKGGPEPSRHGGMECVQHNIRGGGQWGGMFGHV